MRVWVTTLSVAAVLSGCSEPTPSSADATIPQGPAAGELAQQANVKACISNVMQQSVIHLPVEASSSNLMTLNGQSLEGCPGDFTEAFVRFRNAVKAFVSSRDALAAHKLKWDKALQNDMMNVGCSVVFGTQCTGSFVEEWHRQNDLLKQTHDNDRAAKQQAYEEVEAAAARHGITVRLVIPPSGSDNSSAMREDAL